jgi:transcriptional accessory protein Tex/SPT6
VVKVTKAAKAAKAPVKKKKAAASKKDGVAKKSAATKTPTAKKAAVTKKAAAAKKAAPAKKRAPEMKAEPVKSTVKKSSAPSSQDPPKRRSSTPPPAVNEPLAFITFVATYPVGTTLEGEVVSFTSHGAMVDVALPDGGSLHCYIPLSAMGDPPPTKARQMLTKGEVRLFVLSSLDPPRRVAELSLPAPPAKKRRSPTKKAAKARP